jgi:Uma2 family endonuclease
VAPELIVEIVSLSDRWQEVEDKISDYFSVGVEQVWVVHPPQQTIYVYRSRSERQLYGRDATLQGEGTITGFSLRVVSLF